MIPVIFINSREVPFVDLIMQGKKIYETRSRDVLRKLFERGERFYIAETGHGRPVVRCSASISEVHELYTAEAWDNFRMFHAVPVGTTFDWSADTKKKVMYKLDDIRSVAPFVLPSACKRHGRVWAEFEGKEV